jgi:hypothetical protein
MSIRHEHVRVGLQDLGEREIGGLAALAATSRHLDVDMLHSDIRVFLTDHPARCEQRGLLRRECVGAGDIVDLAG